MIVVTGSARTGTSLMMRILKEIGYQVPAPQFFGEEGLAMVKFNPDGFYEDPDVMEDGVQHHNFKGMAVKLFGYALSITPKAFVSKVIVCTRDRDAAVRSSIPVFEALHKELGIPNHAKGIEDIYYDVHYRVIEDFLEPEDDYIYVKLEDVQSDPLKELLRIAEFLGTELDRSVTTRIVNSIRKQ